MSLKDEIEKLIHSEQQKLEAQNRKHADYHERKCQRFASLRALLQEISCSVEECYLQTKLGENSATMEIGKKGGGYFSADTCWRVEPNFGVRLHAEKGESLLYEEPGFRVEETEYLYYPEYDTSENIYTFDSEQAVGEYLVKKIAEKVAHYRYLETLAARSKKQQ